MSKTKVAFVSSPHLGWKTVRKRWGEALTAHPAIDYLPLHWDEYAPGVRRLHEKTNRLESLWFSLAARAACREAIRKGYERILVTTIHAAALLPRQKSVRYYVYGDATPIQLKDVYGRRDVKSFDDRFYERIRRYGPDVTHLCMSRWYQEGLARDFDVDPTRTVVLPPSVDVARWKPRAQGSGKPYAVFVGGDFRRKGGEMLQQVARQLVNDLDIVYVTGHEGQAGPNERFVKGLRPDQPELIDLVSQASLFLLPTRADCSPNAIVEATAAGVPSISTRVGGVPELIEDGVTGRVLEEPNPDALLAAIRGYLNDPAMRERQAAAARKRALDLFDAERQIARLTELLVG